MKVGPGTHGQGRARPGLYFEEPDGVNVMHVRNAVPENGNDGACSPSPEVMRCVPGLVWNNM